MLYEASKDNSGRIIRLETLGGGTSISAGKMEFINSPDQREIAKWESALKELLQYRFIQTKESKGEVYVVTDSGYNYIELLCANGGERI